MKIYSKVSLNKQEIFIVSGPYPSYIRLYQTGELQKRAQTLNRRLADCRLCPRLCGKDRTQGKTGVCGASPTLRIARAVPHFGEEPPVSGTRGAGAVFFSFCNLSCCFCQNYQISQDAYGHDITEETLAEKMVHLQEKGCHNINLVSASHFVPRILAALCLAVEKGLRIPLVYNSNGYENVGVLKLLEGIIDIYLPDIKYADNRFSKKYSGAENYPETALAAVKEMFRQVGHLKTDENGIATKGLIVRHLVLPKNISGTKTVLKTLKQIFGTGLFLSLMSQYQPCYRARDYSELSAPLPENAYLAAVNLLEALGFANGWVQDWQPLDKSFVPDFTRQNSWR